LENEFFSASDIISGAVDGSIISLLADITLSENWAISNKKLTFNLN
jgi:hypothetical protein